MENAKKKKIALILIIFLTFIVISNRFIFSYAKYAYNSTRDYFLKSKGFYFYSDTLGTSSINNSNSSWDGGSTHFDLRNSLNNGVATDYDINYDVECSIEGLAANYLECHLMGTELDTYSGTLSAAQGCRNDTNDQVDVSNFNKTTCELNGYIWTSQVATKDIYFDIVNTSSEYEITEVVVNIKATSNNPYNKSLYGKFILEEVGSVEGEIDLDYNSYLNINKLVVSNSFNDTKCLKLTWNPDYVLIGENKLRFSSFKFNENGYINEIDFNADAKSEISYNFYERSYGTVSNLNLIDFNIITQDETNCLYSSIAVTVNANGGVWSGTLPELIYEGLEITLQDPVRDGYNFTGWTAVGTGSSVTGDTLTVGSGDVIVIANWQAILSVLTIDVSGGTWSGTTPQSILSGDTVTIEDPYRSGYVFTGWTVTGTGSTLVGTLFTMGTTNATITANWLAFASMYTYTGTSTIVDDVNGNWRIKFLTSGTFTPLIELTIDAFIVGGGGGGGSGTAAGSGGGGGYTGTWTDITITQNQSYSIVVGNGGSPNVAGGLSSAFGYSKNGGSPGTGAATYSYLDAAGGNGGNGGGGNGSHVANGYWNGGNGGSNGSNGAVGGSGTAPGGIGQGTTTREFGELTGVLYAGGGGGGCYSSARIGGIGGSIGGGRGYGSAGNATSGQANTGSGGGGASDGGGGGAGSGGSGIVVIRNKRN